MRSIPAAIVSIPHSLYPIYIYFLEYRPTGDSFLHVDRCLVLCFFFFSSTHGGNGMVKLMGLSGSPFRGLSRSLGENRVGRSWLRRVAGDMGFL